MPRKPPPPQGAPDWVLTYGDLMSLMLCFFVLLAAFANFDTPNPKLEDVLQSIRSVFGIRGHSGVMANPGFDFSVLLKELEKAVRRAQLEKRSTTDIKGVAGRYANVRKIRDGAEITMGGPVVFRQFSAELLPEAAAMVDGIAATLAGHLNRIEVRGHATAEPLPPDSPFKDPMDLSIARARAVAHRLIAGGVIPRTLRLVGAGASEPFVPRPQNPEQVAANRRVEIVVRESVVADYDGQGAASQPASVSTDTDTVVVD